MDRHLRKILIVDDEEDTAMLVADGLRRRGFDSTYVTSGARCLERLAAEQVDVVITDVQMPGMTGLELCERLRARHPACATIVLSGHSTAAEAGRAGAFAYFKKPTKIDVLAREVDRALATSASR